MIEDQEKSQKSSKLNNNQIELMNNSAASDDVASNAKLSLSRDEIKIDGVPEEVVRHKNTRPFGQEAQFDYSRK